MELNRWRLSGIHFQGVWTDSLNPDLHRDIILYGGLRSLVAIIAKKQNVLVFRKQYRDNFAQGSRERNSDRSFALDPHGLESAISSSSSGHIQSIYISSYV